MPKHPLETDRSLERRVRNIIYIEIYAVLGWPRTDNNRALQGTGMGVEDIAAEAYADIWMFDPTQLRGSWEALARSIAHNKTVKALRAAGKGLRGTEHRPELRLVSGDAETTGQDGEPRRIFDSIPAESEEFENETIDKINAHALNELARGIFDERQYKIFTCVAHEGRSYVEVGDIINMTGARVGQIFNQLIDQLMQHPENPFLDDD